MVIAAQGNEQFLPCRLRFGIVSVAVRTTPNAQPTADFRRRVRDGFITVRILPPKRILPLCRIQSAGTVQIAGIPRVYIELHPEPVAHKPEKRQIGKRLRLRRALVGAVHPTEILRTRRRLLIRTGSFPVFLHNSLPHFCVLYTSGSAVIRSIVAP